MENTELKKALLAREAELSAEIKARMERRKEYAKNFKSQKVPIKHYSDLADKYFKNAHHLGR